MDVDRPRCGSTLVRNHDENKTYVLVKLSESFSNAIQEYHASNNRTGASLALNPNNHQLDTPTIKFHGSRGAIRFPNGKSYDFSLEQSDNAVECVRQTRNRWESVGRMACSLHVKGKDDVYQRTKTKMEAAEQEKRKYCTKLLGSPENKTSHKTAKLLDMKSTSDTKPSSLMSSSSTFSSASSSSSTSSTSHHTNHQHSLHTTNTNNHLNHHPHKGNNNNNNNNNNNSSYTNLSKYPDIIDVKQMKRYKADFDKDFKEYQTLHGYLQKIEERFKILRDKLKQSVEGSPEWESAKEQIFSEYERVKGDSNFHKARSKYKQLYNKLAHIKEKIFQFKRQNRDRYNNKKKRKR